MESVFFILQFFQPHSVEPQTVWKRCMRERISLWGMLSKMNEVFLKVKDDHPSIATPPVTSLLPYLPLMRMTVALITDEIMGNTAKETLVFVSYTNNTRDSFALSQKLMISIFLSLVS